MTRSPDLLDAAMLLAAALLAWGVLSPRRSSVPGEAFGSAGHDDWLLDEALAETFPASDPISPAAVT